MDISVFLVDDQPDVRLLWRMLIEQANEGLHVIGEAGTGDETLDQDPDADVFVVDYMMPGMTGTELVSALRARGSNAPIVLCSALLDDQVNRHAAEVGVSACLNKDAVSGLPDAIRAVAA